MPPVAISNIKDFVRAFAAILAITCGLYATTGGAVAYDLGAIGGKGGEAFDSRCRSKDALIGINLRSGTALDAVTAICIPVSKKFEWAGKAYEPTQYWGGSGGGYQKVACQPGYVVQKLTVYAMRWGDAAVVNSASIRCKNFLTFHEYDVAPRRAGKIIGSDSNNCDRGYANGIHGGYGNLVDRLGLSCR